MKGKILDFNIQDSKGVISAENGERYNFTTQEWKSSDTHPTAGVEVDFNVDGENATGIYATAAAATQVASQDYVEAKAEAQNIFGYYISAFKKYATFSGRATRSEFWYFQLISFIVSIILSAISAGTLGLIYSLAVMIPALAIGARRLHDTGKSGWWQLLMIIPLIGIIVLIVFWAQDTKREKTKFDI